MDVKDESPKKAPRYFVADEHKANPEEGSAELNFLEFPFALLAENHGGQKTLESVDTVDDFETGQRIERKCIVTGSDKWGLPGWMDIDLVLALMKLTSEQTRWADNYLNVSLYEICKQLRLPHNDGRYTKRLQEGILRIKATTICYQNGWRKNGRWTSTEAFSILDNVKLSNTREFYDADETQRVKWNDVIVESMQKQHSKGLDWDFYVSLKKPTSKRLSLFLDKRWGHMSGVSYSLADFCVNKLGLKAGQDARRYRQRLEQPIAELIERGFPLAATFEGRGKNSRVVFERRVRKKGKHAASRVGQENPCGVTQDLIERGVVNGAALVEKFGVEHCSKQVENFDHRRDMGEELGAGWLGKACADADGFSFRKDFESKESRAEKCRVIEAKKADQETKQRRAREVRREQELREQSMVEAYLKNLRSRGELEAFEQEALSANSFARGQYERAKRSNGESRLYLDVAVKALVLKKLAESGVENASA